MLGLPDAVRACLFDLDGVLTRTADVHAQAWKAIFDDDLRERAERDGEPFRPFDAHDDDECVDGKPREDALAGVVAGRAGGFAFVVGVDRVGQAEALLAHGAPIVVQDLAELPDDG